MVESLSVFDLLKVYADLHERLQAPSRLVGRSRYLLERECRITSFLNADLAIGEPHSSTEERPVAAELAIHPALNSASRSRGPFSSFFHYLKLVARSDAYSELFTELHSTQNDGLFELLLGGQHEIRQRLDMIDFHLHIHPCQNIAAACRLRTSPFIIIGNVTDAFTRNHQSLDSCIRERDTPSFSASWDQTPVAATLFGRPAEVRKFVVLVGVANALTIAHKSHWYHRRLSASSIFVNTELNHLSSLQDVAAHGKELVKVGDFLCPMTGCFDGCGKCTVRSRHAISNPGDFFSAVAREDTVLFSKHGDDFDLKNGERIDCVSFARLIVWIYAGASAPMNFESVSDLREDIISRVPWPLRWIIRDCKDLSMRIVLLYLRALQDLKILPHAPPEAFLALPGSASSNPLMTTERANSLLNQACVRAVTMGAETEEPEALIHLGIYWEGCATLVWKRADGDASHSIRCSYECFKYAALLGESDGLFHMARLQRKGLTPKGFHPFTGASEVAMIRLLLKACVCGNAKALRSLKIMSRSGIFGEGAFTNATKDEGVECIVEKDLLDVVVDVAMCLRRGSSGFPMDHDEATRLLEAARSRLHPRGCLELGLLKVQLKKSLESVRMGVNLVCEASNAAPAPASYEAHFWLGKWYHTGLVVPGLPEQVVQPNFCLALAHVQTGAKKGKHPDCMALLAKFFRDGLGNLAKDERKAVKWNEEARKKLSPLAHYGYAAVKIRQAKEALRLLTDSSSSELERRTISFTEDSEKKLRLPSLKGSRKRASSSSTSDSSSSNLSDGYRDSQGRVTRRGIARYFEIALDALTETGTQLSTSHPEEALNPKPLLAAADLIRKYVDKWAACACENEPEMQRYFIEEKLSEARRFLKKASSLDSDPRWKQTRVNYIDEDWAAILKARDLLQKWVGARGKGTMHDHNPG